MPDKALSLPYDQLVESIKKTGSTGKSENRRVILEWLKSNIVAAVDLLNRMGRKTALETRDSMFLFESDEEL